VFETPGLSSASLSFQGAHAALNTRMGLSCHSLSAALLSAISFRQMAGGVLSLQPGGAKVIEQAKDWVQAGTKSPGALILLL